MTIAEWHCCRQALVTTAFQAHPLVHTCATGERLRSISWMPPMDPATTATTATTAATTAAPRAAAGGATKESGAGNPSSSRSDEDTALERCVFMTAGDEGVVTIYDIR
jgi:hypothetical protein